MQVMFSYSIASKCWNAFAICFAFAIVFCVFCSYQLYYDCYAKLARYFLSNMYRFKSSYILMTLTFGVRPFLKGIVHALLFEHWLAQIWALIGIEAGIVAIIMLFEILLDSHKSRLILLFELLYSSTFIAVNVLLLLKHEYLLGKKELEVELEIYMKLLVYFMLILLLLRLLAEIKNALDCKCNSTSVVPAETTNEKKKKGKNKKKEEKEGEMKKEGGRNKSKGKSKEKKGKSKERQKKSEEKKDKSKKK